MCQNFEPQGKTSIGLACNENSDQVNKPTDNIHMNGVRIIKVARLFVKKIYLKIT